LPALKKPRTRISPKHPALHFQSPVTDLHCDSILNHLTGKWDITQHTRGHIDLPKLQAGGVRVQVFAIFPDPKKIKSGEYERFVLNAVKMIKQICRSNANRLGLALSPADLKRIINSNRIAVVVGVEGGHSLEGDLKRLIRFFNAGVRILTITWCNSNELADASWDHSQPHNGLSPLGRRAVQLMNQLGMLVDVSHASEHSFYQIIEASSVPVIASHSGVYALRRHNRNLKHRQLAALKENGGVMGQVFLPAFLNPVPAKASIADVLRSIDYVVQRFGPELVGLGSDFDGFTGRLKGLEDASKLPAITQGLLNMGYLEQDIRPILGLNFLKLWERVFQGRKIKSTKEAR